MSKAADPALSALAEQHGLGAFHTRHAVFKEAYKAGLWLLGAGLFVPGAVALYVLAPDAVPIWAVLLFAGLGVVGLVLGPMLLFPLPFIKLQSHERGFVYKSFKGVEVVPYADVVGVQARVTTTTQHHGGATSISRSGQVNAYLRDGRMIAVNPNLENVKAFMEELVQGAAPAVIEAARATVAAGHDFSCGVIALGPQGLKVAGQTYPYSAKLFVKADFDETRVHAKNKVVAKLKTKDVINAPYMEQVVNAAKSTQVPDDRVKIGLEVIAAQQELDAAVIQAVSSIAPPEWPVVVVEMGISSRLENLVVMDKSGASMLPPNAELMDLGNRVAQIHQRHKTGANRVRLTLEQASSGWSVGSEFLKVG
jgi:hypothetical protein